MLKLSSRSATAIPKRFKVPGSVRGKQQRRRAVLERLEDRTLLSYTFAYSNPNDVTVNESGGSDSFNIEVSGNQLEYSINGGAFSANWGGPGNFVNASNSTSVFINLSADNSAIIDGTSSSPASAVQADLEVTAATGNSNDTLTINDSASTSSNFYLIGSTAGKISGGGISVTPEGGVQFAGGETLLASDGDDTINALGNGIPDGTTLTVSSSGGQNTVNYDAGGDTPTINSSSSGQISLSVPAAGILSVNDVRAANVSDVPPITITPGATQSIHVVQNTPFNDEVIGTFTVTDPSIVAPLPAGDFTATIDWGDATTSAATIVQDAGGVYSIIGSHNYAVDGTFTVTDSIDFSGDADYATVLNGVALSVAFPASGPTAGTNATANVAQPPITVSVDSVVGTAGLAIPAGPIATFIDPSGDSVGDLSATITIIDAGNATDVDVPAASIMQQGTSDEYTVNAPSFTLPTAGSYQVVVAVTDNTLTSTGSNFAVIGGPAGSSSLPLAVTVFPIVGEEGVPTVPATTIATFVDGAGGPPSDYAATISAVGFGGTSIFTVTAASISSTGLDEYSVQAPAMTFPEAGTYQLFVAVTYTPGPTTVPGASIATIVDAPLTAQATPNLVVMKTGITTGSVVTANFSDGNPTAPLDDFTAVIHWGDGISSAGAVTQPGGIGTAFIVHGAHTYATAGVFTVTTSVTDSDGAKLNLDITATVGNQLSFTTQPTNAVAGITITPFIQVTAKDAAGNVLTKDNSTVMLKVAGGPDGGSIMGNNTAQFHNGVATFKNVNFHQAGTYTLLATDGKFATALSNSFVVTAAAANKMIFSTQPSNTGSGDPFTVVVELLDRWGNVATNDSSSVTILLQQHPKNGILDGTTTIAVTDGMASFTTLSLATDGTYSLKATDGKISSVTSKSFKIS